MHIVSHDTALIFKHDVRHAPRRNSAKLLIPRKVPRIHHLSETFHRIEAHPRNPKGVYTGISRNIRHIIPLCPCFTQPRRGDMPR